MCGIAGILHLDGNPACPLALKGMSDVIAHRGPDGEGHYLDGPLGLAHRRLSIIDLSDAGRQPMTTPDGGHVLVFNGEIYNFAELRTELEAIGCVFRSRTDSEVVLHALAEWGAEAVSRFNGMFSLAWWNRATRTLVLVRDRYGIKPLYTARFGNVFLFGSEVKAILSHPQARCRMDRHGLLEYFTFQNFFSGRTLFDGIELVPAGSLLTIRAELGIGASPSLSTYWDYCFQEPVIRRSDEDYIEELDQLFQQAVKRQLVSDVPVGSYLSGGMDSGSITAVAAHQLPYINSFTCGFDLSSASGIELNFDERAAAERMSAAFRTEHYEMVLKAGDMERCMPTLVRHLEEPRVGQSYPNFYAAKLASRFVKVVLSGTGGDELFGGYPWRYYRVAANQSFDDYIDKYYSYWQRLVPNRSLQRLFKPVWNDVKDMWTRDVFHDVFSPHQRDITARPEDYVNHSLYFEAKTFLHSLLIVDDKLSMSHSLETRVPFLDNDLVDFAMRLPVNLKLGRLDEVVKLNENEPGAKSSRYFQKTNDGKLLLRRMMARHLPKEVVDREKQGFSAPDASWFRGDSIAFVRRALLETPSPLYDFLDRSTVEELVLDHLEGHENRRLLIWSLLSVNEWCRQFLDHGTV